MADDFVASSRDKNFIGKELLHDDACHSLLLKLFEDDAERRSSVYCNRGLQDPLPRCFDGEETRNDDVVLTGVRAEPSAAPPTANFPVPKVLSLCDLQDAVIVRDLARYEGAGRTDAERLQFIREALLKPLNLDEPPLTIVPGKIPGLIYLYDLSNQDTPRLCSYVRQRYPALRCETRLLFKLEPRHEPDVTTMLLHVLDEDGRSQMTYQSLYEQLQLIPLTKDLPFDGKLLQETMTAGVGRIGFNFVTEGALKLAASNHLTVVVSLRVLARVVHQMLDTAEDPIFMSPPSSPRRCQSQDVRLDRQFLQRVQEKIGSIDCLPESPTKDGRDDKVHMFGEGQPKSLEYLITCVPGIEVLYTFGYKYIRKIDLSERTHDREPQVVQKLQRRQTPHQNPSQDPVKERVRQITSILKKADNQYLTVRELHSKLREVGEDFDESELREFIVQNVKFFQLLTLGCPELVTLSHRGQIKRISNDMQKVLRQVAPRYLTTRQLPSAFMALWRSPDPAGSRPSGDSWARFNVSLFGVCFLDDIMVTIPQNWGVHCSAYISNTDGRLMKREYGDGEENVPDFVQLRCSDGRMFGTQEPPGFKDLCGVLDSLDDRYDGRYDEVCAWAPQSKLSDLQKRKLAIFRQQLLNMYRGNPDGAKLLRFLEHSEARHSPSRDRCKRFDRAALRANLNRNGRQMPCDLRLHFDHFIPTFHHVYDMQPTLSWYGAKTLHELFELVNETIQLSHAVPGECFILPTPDAKRQILERRLAYLLREHGGPITYEKLLALYLAQPTMAPYFNEEEIMEALFRCSLFVPQKNGDELVISVKPRFCPKEAVLKYGDDIARLLLVFVSAFNSLTAAELQARFKASSWVPFSLDTLTALVDLGAVRESEDSEGGPTRYDLQDDCRVVRNLVHQMNGDPRADYYVYHSADGHGPYGFQHETSIASLLEKSGDFMYADFNIDAMLSSYPFIFHRREGGPSLRHRSTFRLCSWVDLHCPDPENFGQHGRRR